MQLQQSDESIQLDEWKNREKGCFSVGYGFGNELLFADFRPVVMGLKILRKLGFNRFSISFTKQIEWQVLVRWIVTWQNMGRKFVLARITNSVLRISRLMNSCRFRHFCCWSVTELVKNINKHILLTTKNFLFFEKDFRAKDQGKCWINGSCIGRVSPELWRA